MPRAEPRADVVGNAVDVMRIEVTRLTRNRFPGRYKAS